MKRRQRDYKFVQSIIVIGGGIVGLSSALALARCGFVVTVLEPDAAHQAASWGNAGHIATEQVVPLAAPQFVRSVPSRLFVAGGALALPPRMIVDWAPFVFRLLRASTAAKAKAGTRALGALLGQAMPAWQRLVDSIGTPDLLSENGHLVVWENARDAEAGRRFWNAAETGTASVGNMTDDDRRAIVSAVRTPFADAIRFAGSGQVRDLDRLRAALEQALAAEGVGIERSTGVLSVANGLARVKGIEADIVLVAAGAGSGWLMRSAGHRVPMIAERGYHLRAAGDHWPKNLPPVVFEQRSLIVTRFDNRVQAASFVEFGSPDAPPDPRKWKRLEGHVSELGLAFGPPYSRWMGSRPTLPDYLPAIGRSHRARNLFYAFGHQHLGLTLAPITAEIISMLVSGETPSIDIAPFDIARFGNARK